MPISLICRRCGTELHTEDVFCQECGLKCPSAEKTFADGPSLSARAEGDERENSAEKQNQETISDWQSLERTLKQEDRVSENSHAEAQVDEKANRLNSPLFNKSPQSTPIQNNLGWRGGWHVVVADLAAIVAVVAFGIMLTNFALHALKQNEKSQLSKKVSALSRQIKTATASRDYAAVLKALADMKSARELTVQEQALLNEAAFRLGQEELAKGQKHNAIEHLKQVSILSDYYVGAQETLFNVILPVVQPSPPVQKIRNRRSPRRTAAIPAVQNTPSLSSEAVLSIPTIPEIETKPETESEGNQNTDKAEAAPVPKFSESEISHYNRLLGVYFAKHKSDKASEEHPEPPSFKEWIKEGKPGF